MKFSNESIVNIILLFCSQVPDTPVEQVLYIYKIYKNLIDYFIRHKACLAHIKPSHLLCYKDYVMYMTRVPYNPHTINRKVNIYIFSIKK